MFITFHADFQHMLQIQKLHFNCDDVAEPTTAGHKCQPADDNALLPPGYPRGHHPDQHTGPRHSLQDRTMNRRTWKIFPLIFFFCCCSKKEFLNVCSKIFQIMYTLFGKCNLCFHSPVKLSRAVKMAPGRTTTSTPVMLRGFTSSTVSHLKTSSLSQFNTSFMNHIRTSPVCHLRKAPKSVYRIFVSIYCESNYYYNKKYK